MTEDRQAALAALYAEDDRLTEEMNRIRRIQSALRKRIQGEEAILRQAVVLARVKRKSAS
jgi:hypothetical protein